MIGGKARPKGGFHLDVLNQPVPDSRGWSLAKKPHLKIRIRRCQDSRKSSGHVSGGSSDSRKNESHGDCIPNVFQSTTSSTSSSSNVQVGTLPQFLDQRENITFNMFVLNIIRGLHYRCCPLLFCNFKQCIIKDATADQPIIQKKVDELLAKGAIETSTGGASFN